MRVKYEWPGSFLIKSNDMSYNNIIEIGVISDTHGTLPRLVPEIFKATDLIIHAGDIDKEDVLKELCDISPVVAVKGNMDFGEWASRLKAAETIDAGDVSMYMLHNIEKLDIEPDGIFDAVIFGHTHMPYVKRHGSVIFLNPGSASYPRNSVSASVALLHISGAKIDVEFVEIK